MNAVVGGHDLLLVTLDTLRYDVAAEELAAGRTPALARMLPGGVWERRHTPASFTYAAHHAFFAGFLPTPTAPGPHPRLFAAGFPGSLSTDEHTWVFAEPDIVSALRQRGYHTACVGGVGFFSGRSALGRVLPDLFTESHWEPHFGVTEPDSTRHQVDRVERIVAMAPPGPLFVFVNISALHQPNRHYLPGATEDCRASQAAALTYVDGQLDRLIQAMVGRGRPCLVILCSDHGTAYGEDGHVGHRVAHECVWTVPYAHFVMRASAEAGKQEA
jgi:arylsulfatase A-like enzyme